MDFNYVEKYVGEGLFGKSNYKKMWCYSGFREAAKDFIDDFTRTIGYMSSDIEDRAVIDVNHALENFEKNVKEELSAKISGLENYVKILHFARFIGTIDLFMDLEYPIKFDSAEMIKESFEETDTKLTP